MVVGVVHEVPNESLWQKDRVDQLRRAETHVASLGRQPRTASQLSLYRGDRPSSSKSEFSVASKLQRFFSGGNPVHCILDHVCMAEIANFRLGWRYQELFHINESVTVAVGIVDEIVPSDFRTAKTPNFAIGVIEGCVLDSVVAFVGVPIHRFVVTVFAQCLVEAFETHFFFQCQRCPASLFVAGVAVVLTRRQLAP